MFAQGMTLKQVGEEFGISRERVRQILKRLDIFPSDGGAAIKREIKKKELEDDRNAKSYAKYGVSYKALKELRRIGALRAYQYQKRNAKIRAIPWKLTFIQWWTIWERSGKYQERGRAKESYVMSRIKDSGGYEFGNVCIKTLQENSREAVKVWKGREKQIPKGVYNNYPGTARPFLAKVGKHSLGTFETADLARQAREMFIQSCA